MRIRRLLAALGMAFLSHSSSANAGLCELLEGNYLQDPMFVARNAGGALQHWVSSRHAGEESFALEFDDGELTILKTGTQPWFYFRQVVAGEELAGKKLAVTAELKLDMPPSQLPKVGGGLKVVARSGSLQGRKLLLRSILDHQPHNGKTEWFPVQVVIQLPEKTSTVEVGFLHQADGTLRVRNPSLQMVDESSGPCAVSPNAILGVPRAASSLR